MIADNPQETPILSAESDPNSIPVLPFSEFIERFDEIIEHGQRVEVQDFPIEILLGIDEFPCDTHSVQSLADRILTARFDQSTQPQREGVLDNVKVTIVPAEEAEEADALLAGDHGWLPQVTNGFHRILAKMALFSRYPEHFTPTIPVEIRPGTWEDVCRLRAQAQENKITVAPARILPFIEGGYARTSFGKRINIATALQNQGLVTKVAARFGGRDIRTLDRQELEPAVRETIGTFCRRQRIKPEEYYDVGWAALFETYLILRYFTLDPNEAAAFIRIGRSLAPEIASRVRKLDQRSFTSEPDEENDQLIIIAINEIPHTVADVLSRKYGGRPNYPIQRAISRILTGILSRERGYGVGVGECQEFINLVDSIGIQEMLDNRWEFSKRAVEDETFEQKYTDFLTSLMHRLASFRTKLTPEAVSGIHHSMRARTILLPVDFTLDDIFPQLARILEELDLNQNETITEPPPDTLAGSEAPVQSTGQESAPTLLQPVSTPDETHASPISDPFRAVVDSFTEQKIHDLKAFIRAIHTAIRLAGRLSILECIGKNGYSEPEITAINKASSEIIQHLPRILRRMGIPYFSKEAVEELESGNVPVNIHVLLEDIVMAVASRASDPAAIKAYLHALSSEPADHATPGEMVRNVRHYLTADPIPPERAQEIQMALLAAMTKNVQALYRLLFEASLDCIPSDREGTAVRNAAAFAIQLSDLADPDMELGNEDKQLLSLVRDLGM